MPNLLFSFEDLSSKDKVIKKIEQAFKKASMIVIETLVDTKIKRSNSISYREVTLTCNDSQKVTFRIKQTGDIFQVLVNEKVLPIKAQDDHFKAIEEIVQALDSGRAKFQKMLARVKVRLPPSIKTAAPKMEEMLTSRRDELKGAIEATLAEIAALGGGSTLDSVSSSDLGQVFTEYENDPEGAIERLMKEKSGDARAVWYRQDLGTIDLIYGNAKAGLAHIAAKHPEMLKKLPALLKKGRLVRKSESRKVFLIQEGNPPEVAVISLDWLGSAKTWVVTGYEDIHGVFTGRLKTMNTEALDSTQMTIPHADQ